MTIRRPLFLDPTVEIEPCDEGDPFRFRLRSTRRGRLLEQRLVETLDEALEVARTLITGEPPSSDDVVIRDPREFLLNFFHPPEATMTDETKPAPASITEDEVAERLFGQWLREADGDEIRRRLLTLPEMAYLHLSRNLARDLGLLDDFNRRVAEIAVSARLTRW